MAYYISGHGAIEGGRFRVPEGSTVVVMARPGEKTLGSMFSTFCRILPDVLLNPTAPPNRATLTEHFGSLAFYPAGSWCPNFAYSLASCFGNPFVPQQKFLCTWIGSGVIPLERIQDLCGGSLMNTVFQPSKVAGGADVFNADSFDFFTDSDGFKSVEALAAFLGTHIYHNSVEPTATQVQDELLRNPVFKEILRKHDLRDEQVFRAFEALGPLIDVSQSDLCSRMPGVYFNFICRPDELTDSVFRSVTNGVASAMFKNHNVTTRNPRMSRRSNASNYKNTSLIRRQIEEAEFYRKPAIRNWSVRLKKRGTKEKRRKTHRRSTVKV